MFSGGYIERAKLAFSRRTPTARKGDIRGAPPPLPFGVSL